MILNELAHEFLFLVAIWWDNGFEGLWLIRFIKRHSFLHRTLFKRCLLWRGTRNERRLSFELEIFSVFWWLEKVCSSLWKIQTFLVCSCKYALASSIARKVNVRIVSWHSKNLIRITYLFENLNLLGSSRYWPFMITFLTIFAGDAVKILS